jgi:peptide/nickel transport system permease protein
LIALSVAGLLARRLLTAVPILLVVSMLLFAALRLLPVDPAAMSMPPTASSAEIAAQRISMGLDRPLAAQYAIWLRGAVRGDFGRSIQLRRAAGALVAQTLPATVELALAAMLVATVLGVGGGLALFAWHGTAVEAAGDLGATLMMSLPDFLWALLFILIFGVLVPVLPFMGRLSAGAALPAGSGFLLADSLLAGRLDVFADALRHMVLPAGALGIAFAPPVMRVLRGSLLDVYGADYIFHARLRGVSEARLLLRHALPNALLPTVTLMGVQFGFLFGGTLLVEIIFSYPGMGNLMVDAVRNADLPVIQTVGLAYCLAVLAINSLVDALYVVLDPRLRG